MPAVSTYTDKTFNADKYQTVRPLYPGSLYDHLRKYMGLKPKEKVGVAVDLACGTGQATLTIANTLADKVVGVDNSEVMIKKARESAPGGSTVEYIVGNDQTLTTQFELHSIDLLTVAEAAHYLSYPGFWDAARQILKPGGTLAIWSYYLPNVIGYPAITKILEDFSSNPEKCGNNWDSGIKLLKDGMYADLTVPSDLFVDEERVNNDFLRLRPEQPFELVKNNATIGDLINLLGTWSAYHKWKTTNTGKKDILEEAKEDIVSSTGLTLDSKVTFKWETVFIFVKSTPTP